MSWARPNLPHMTANAQLDAVMVVISRKLGRKYHTNRVSNLGPVVCKSITLTACPQRLPHCVEPRCSLHTLERRSPIGLLCDFIQCDYFSNTCMNKSPPPCISSGAVGMTIYLCAQPKLCSCMLI